PLRRDSRLPSLNVVEDSFRRSPAQIFDVLEVRIQQISNRLDIHVRNALQFRLERFVINFLLPGRSCHGWYRTESSINRPVKGSRIASGWITHNIYYV